MAINARTLRLKTGPKPQGKAEPQAEPKPASSAEAKAEPKPEAKSEAKAPEADAEPKPEAKAEPKTEAKVEPKPEAKTDASQPPVAPQVVRRVHELYEQLGREDVRAVQAWEDLQRESQKPSPKPDGAHAKPGNRP